MLTSQGNAHVNASSLLNCLYRNHHFLHEDKQCFVTTVLPDIDNYQQYIPRAQNDVRKPIFTSQLIPRRRLHATSPTFLSSADLSWDRGAWPASSNNGAAFHTFILQPFPLSLEPARKHDQGKEH